MALFALSCGDDDVGDKKKSSAVENNTITKEGACGEKQNVSIALPKQIEVETEIQSSDPRLAFATKNGLVGLKPFLVAETPVTNKLWKQVSAWAKEHGYKFQHEIDSKLLELGDGYPALTVSYKESLVWLNALSEMVYGGDCQSVYKLDGKVVKDATQDIENAKADENAKGFRLPTHQEFMFAARGGLKSTKEVFESNFVGTATATEEEACKYMSCVDIQEPTRVKTETVKEVKDKSPNDLGLYDMVLNGGKWLYNFEFKATKIIFYEFDEDVNYIEEDSNNIKDPKATNWATTFRIYQSK